MSSPTTNLAEVLAAALASLQRDLHVALPGKVESYTASRQEADVQPMVQNVYTTEEGERATENFPVIPNVPVLMSGAGGFRVTYPVQVGDPVLIVVSSRSIDQWLSSQGTGKPLDPIDDRTHHLTDAIAIPGLRPFDNPWQRAPGNTFTVGADTGNAFIEFTNTEILAGGAGAFELALKSAVDTIISAFNTHTHPVPAAPGTSSPTLTPISPQPGTTVLKGK